MKIALRRFVLGVAGFAIVAIVALPGVIGWQLGKLSAVPSQDVTLPAPLSSLEISSFRRGWFRSDATVSVGTDQNWADFLPPGWIRPEIAAKPLSVRMDGRLHQGPAPLSALTTSAAQFGPAWLLARSTITLTSGREQIELPAVIHTRVGLVGNLTNFIAIENLDTFRSIPAGRLMLEEATATLAHNRQGIFDALQAELTGLEVSAERASGAANQLSLSVGAESSEETAHVVQLGAAGVRLTSVDTTVTANRIDASVRLGPRQVGLSLAVADQSLPEGTPVSYRGKAQINGVSGPDIYRVLSKTTSSAPDWDAWSAALAARSTALSLEALTIDYNGGQILADAELQLAAGGRTLGGVLQRASGTGTLRISGQLMRALVRSGKAASMTWLSYMVADGDDYVLKATLADGTLDLNGIRFPIRGD